MNPIIKISLLIISQYLCQGEELCSPSSKKYCCDPKGGSDNYPPGSSYAEGCTEYTCKKQYRKKATWDETKNLCPPALICPSRDISCVGPPENTPETIFNLPSYESCGERCKENKDCFFWTFDLSPHLIYPPITICSLLKSCFEEEKNGTISGNNLCPLENPFPCPRSLFSCVAQNDTNVIATVSAESYEYCGERCFEESRCQFWTFSPAVLLPFSPPTCLLLDSCAPHPVFFLPGLISPAQSGDFQCPPVLGPRSSCSCNGICLACVPIIGCLKCIPLPLPAIAPLAPSLPCSSSCPPGAFCAICTIAGCLRCQSIPPAAGEHTSLALGGQNNVRDCYCPNGGTCTMCGLNNVCYHCEPCPTCGYTSAEPSSLPEVCSYMALSHHSGNCSTECEDISSNGDNCNTCLQSALPENCGLVPEFSTCLKCAKHVFDAIDKCSKESISPSGIITCAKAVLAATPDCLECLCSLICFFWPHGSLCKFCGEDSSAAQLWFADDQCPLGSQKSIDGTCFKAFKDLKTFSEAEAACGNLAKVSSPNRILTVNQAMTISQLTECWIGAKIAPGETQFEWVLDNSQVTTPNFARGFPTGLNPSCLTQSTRDGYWRNRDCNYKYCYVCIV